jgi:2-dehydropantoate 2-reductase
VNAIVGSVIDEVIMVASKIGVNQAMLENAKHDIMTRMKARSFKPSMLVDLEAGRPIEVEVIVGDVVRTAAEVDVSVPRCVSRVIFWGCGWFNN